MQCLVDSALGAFDWDTFCTFAIPFTLMCAVAITRAADFNSLRYSCILLALIGASLVRLVPWFTLNANLEKASDYAINVAKYDPHQQLDTRKYSLSTRLRDVGLKDKAFAIAKELNEKDGKSNAVPKNNYAMNLVDAGRYDEALVVYREIVGKYPGYYNANANLGELYVEHYDQNDSARKYLDRALSIRPDASDVLYALAFVEIKAGRFNEAREKLLRTIASNPLHADAHAKLGMVDVQLGNINEGVMHLDKAVELGGIPTPTLMWICQTYQKLGLPAKEKICRDAMAKVK
jgi:tetratricopeptide (TPR) repeat protein